MHHLRTQVSGRQCGGAELRAGLGDLRALTNSVVLWVKFIKLT